MTRAEMMEKLFGMANELTKDYTWDKYCELFNACHDWNRDHEENEEIFVCEVFKEDGFANDGIAVEDEYFFYKKEVHYDR